MRAATVGAAEDGAVRVNVELTNFTAQISSAPCGFTTHTAEPLLVTNRNQAVSYWSRDGGGSEAGTHGPQGFQTLLMTHEVTHLAEEARQPPDELAAAVAERGLGQRHLPEAVPSGGALEPGSRRG